MAIKLQPLDFLMSNVIFLSFEFVASVYIMYICIWTIVFLNDDYAFWVFNSADDLCQLCSAGYLHTISKEWLKCCKWSFGKYIVMYIF